MTDRVTVTLEKHAAILDAVERFRDYIKSEVLATDLVLAPDGEGLNGEKVELEDGVVVGIEVQVN